MTARSVPGECESDDRVLTLSLTLIVSTLIDAVMFPSPVTVGADRILVAGRDIERPTVGEQTPVELSATRRDVLEPSAPIRLSGRNHRSSDTASEEASPDTGGIDGSVADSADRTARFDGDERVRSRREFRELPISRRFITLTLDQRI